MKILGTPRAPGCDYEGRGWKAASAPAEAVVFAPEGPGRDKSLFAEGNEERCHEGRALKLDLEGYG